MDIGIKIVGDPDGIKNADQTTVYFAGRFLTILLSIGTIIIIYIIGTLLGGRTAGLAVGTKYTAFIIVFPLVYAHLYSNSFSIKKSIDKKVILIVLLLVLAFLVTTPYALLDFETFKKDILFESRHYSGPHVGKYSSGNSYLPYFLFLIDGFGIIPFIISVFGIWYMMVKEKRKGLFLLAFPLLFFLFIGRYSVHFSRNLLALIPFLSIFGGLLIAASIDIFQRYRKSRLKVLLLAGLVILSMAGLYGVYEQGHKSYKYVKRITLFNTQWESTLWMNKNLPPGSKIALEHYTPRPDRKLFKLSYLGICGLKRARLKLDEFDYIVASSSDYGRFFANKKKYAKQIRIYNRMFKK